MYLVFIYYAYVYNVLHFILNKSINQKQVNPPALLPVTSGPSYEEVTRTQTSLHRAQEKDAQWPNSLF